MTKNPNAGFFFLFFFGGGGGGVVCGRKWYGRYEYKRILRQRVQIRGIFFFLGGGGQCW